METKPKAFKVASARLSKYQFQLTTYSKYTMEQSTKVTATPCHREEYFSRKKEARWRETHSLSYKNALSAKKPKWSL